MVVVFIPLFLGESILGLPVHQNGLYPFYRNTKQGYTKLMIWNFTRYPLCWKLVISFQLTNQLHIVSLFLSSCKIGIFFILFYRRKGTGLFFCYCSWSLSKNSQQNLKPQETQLFWDLNMDEILQFCMQLFLVLLSSVRILSMRFCWVHTAVNKWRQISVV